MSEWRPIETAPKADRTRVLLCFKKDLSQYADSEERADSLSRWHGLMFVGRHEGFTPSGFDMGWSFAAPVGYGGLPDQWLAGWMPLPTPPGDPQ